jgi:hypothetical protein
MDAGVGCEASSDPCVVVTGVDQDCPGRSDDDAKTVRKVSRAGVVLTVEETADRMTGRPRVFDNPDRARLQSQAQWAETVSSASLFRTIPSTDG